MHQADVSEEDLYFENLGETFQNVVWGSGLVLILWACSMS